MILKALKFILKFSFTFVLLFYLIRTGKISLEKLNLLIENPLILFSFLFAICFVIIPLGALRWHLFLVKAGVHISFTYTVILTWIGNFFNSALPGAVSGDLVKGYYIHKTNKNISKSVTFTSLLIDRLVGLFALVIIAFVGMVMNFSEIQSNGVLHTLSIFIGIAFFATLIFYALLLFDFNFSLPRHPADSRLSKLIEKVFKVFAAFKAYQKHKAILALTLLISVSIHFITAFMFFVIAKLFEVRNFHYLQQLFIMPLGLITTAVPIAPGGIGVGHVAFDTLYKQMGINSGANIFNLYVVIQLGTFLLGSIPYLLHKNKPISTDFDAANVN